MREVLFSELAVQDIADIWWFLQSERGLKFADKYIDEMNARIKRLTIFPEMGPSRPDIRPTVRMRVLSPYLVLYEIADDLILVVRIVYGARELQKIRLEDPDHSN